MAKTPKHQGLPDKETLLAHIRAGGEAAKADLAKTFGLKGADRRALREMMRELEAEGKLERRGRRRVGGTGDLPPVGVADVVQKDIDGELYVRLTKGGDGVPLARLAPDPKEVRAPGLGDRVLVRFVRREDGEVEAKLIKLLGGEVSKALGVVRKYRGEVRIEQVDRRNKDKFSLPRHEGGELKDGDLVLVKVAEGGREQRFGPKIAHVLEVLGREDQPRAASLIAVHTHGIPTGFPADAEAEAENAPLPTLDGREDLRAIPLITIDPQDARDHDDAVYAEPDSDERNPGGWIVWVAIADVAAYVRPNSALDRQAREKGNSVYFPDRVEPMLPEHLSAGLCSLREGENRACLAVRMVFDAKGHKRSHKFMRGLMRSAAKLSYEQAQAAVDGTPDDKTGPLLEAILKPLWAAHACLSKGRASRSPLAIESSERRVILDKEGEVVSITPRISLEAHKLIEEMMIQANVCAAETLEAKKTPLIYRLHDTPSREKMQSLADFLDTLGLRWDKGQAPRTDRFNRLLDETREGPHAEIVNEVVLRSQMQAYYGTDNIGHFGLNLMRYAHFTSPIRRFADLIVHRALISALGLGQDGLSEQDIARMRDTAEHITLAERRAMAAERDAVDRYVAAYLSDKTGATFEGRITGVTRFGLFIRLTETGADGLVPVSRLGTEYFHHDEAAHALVGERSGQRWPLGMAVEVKLVEATPITGGLLFEMLSEPGPPDPKAKRIVRAPARGRGPRAGRAPPKRGKR